MNKYSLTIVGKLRETSESCTILFKQPGLRKIKYKAGQYITLVFRINGRKYARAYSFSSAPSVDSFLKVTVKRIPNGIVSNYINDKLQVGDVVEVLEPMGDFTLGELKATGTIYLWGGGSGITPLFSIIKEMIKTQPSWIIHLLYGSKNIESTIFYDQLMELQENHPSNFKMTIFFSQMELPSKNTSVQLGRISAEFVSFLLSNKNLTDSLHYICGPIGLKDELRKTLLVLGTPPSSIFSEEFHLAVNSTEFENVQNSKVNILLKGREFDIFVPKGKSILEAALDHEIDIPYSCQTGHCNSCKAKIKSGSLKMLGFDNARVNLLQNEFLLCCSYPLSNQVFLEVE